MRRFRNTFVAVAVAACRQSGDPLPLEDAGTPPSEGAPAPAVSPEAGDAARPAAPEACGTSQRVPPAVALEDGRFVVRCDATSMAVTPFEDGILRVEYAPVPRRASYAVTDELRVQKSVERGSDGEKFVLCTGELTTSIDVHDCRLRVIQKDGTVVVDDGTVGGYFETGSTRGVTRVSPVGERFFGLGLRTGAKLDRRGTTAVAWNTDAYDSTYQGFAPTADPLYESIPFFVGLRDRSAYGVFTDVSYRLRFDMAASSTDRYTIAADGGEFDQYVIAGPQIRDVLRRYAGLTGRMPLPPRWALGFQQSRWESPCPDPSRPFCSASQMLDVARTFRAKRIPADGIFFDIQHMDGYRSFTWDGARFADPAALVRDLESLGFKASVIVDPGIKVDDAYSVYADGKAGGHFLPYVGQVWPGDAVFPDFTASKTRAWWAGLVARPLGVGARGLWIDMNEPSSFIGGTVPASIEVDGDGTKTTMAEVHNVYALLEARATFEGMVAAAPSRRPFVLSRAAFAGQQRFSAVWTGDAPSTWTTLGMTLPMLLGLSLSGMPFAGSDVGGYSGRAESTPELFARWMALGSVSPLFRAHAEKDARRQEPWAFGVEVEEAARDGITLRYELLPYLYSAFHDAALGGTPILRPLVYDFQNEPDLYDIADEAMIGSSILVAPIATVGATSRRVVLPAGRWFELSSGAMVEGSTVVTTAPELLPLGALPAYVREGAIVARGAPTQYVGEAPLDPLTLDVYPGEGTNTFTLYEDDGESPAYQSGVFASTVYTRARTASGVVLGAAARTGTYHPAPRKVVVRFQRVEVAPTAVRVGGAAAPFVYDANERTVSVSLEDNPPYEIAIDYDPRIVDAAPQVVMPIRIKVPAETSHASPISVASSAGGWAHVPLAWDGGDAVGTITAPRGSWVFFKVTRGSWATVEKGPGCVERGNRAAIVRARAGFARELELTVAAWADRCP